MTIQLRRIIFYLFVIIFLVVAPSILLVISGYSLDWRAQTVVRSGMILLQISPEDATIHINGTRDESSSRSRGVIRISSLETGAYTITLEKEGYLSWSQNLTVVAGGVTAPPPISLIRSTQSFVILPFNSHILSTSANGYWSLVSIESTGKQKSLALLDQTRGAFRSLPATPTGLNISTGTIESHWSPDSSSILIMTKGGKTRVGNVYQLDTQQYTPTMKLPEIVRWSADSLSLFLIESFGVQQISIDTGVPKIVATTSGIVDIYSLPNNLLALQQVNKRLQLIRLTTGGSVNASLTNAIGLLPPETRFLHSTFPLPLLKTSTLTLVVEMTSQKFSLLAELPASDTVATTRDDVITSDHGVLYRLESTNPSVVLSTPLLTNKKITAVFSLPHSPWVAVRAGNQLFLHSTPREILPATVMGSWVPEDRMIILEDGLIISALSADPQGKRLYISGKRDADQGVFVRLLTE